TTLRFTFVAAPYHPSTPHPGGFARRVPRNAGEFLRSHRFGDFLRDHQLCISQWPSRSFMLALR
ncbi:MAG: hypothetical protein NTY64_23830, partial [Deltaproteobacteria bacterium]|nr:hypothetical protein [Deltaproteobacteria bacterium]